MKKAIRRSSSDNNSNTEESKTMKKATRRSSSDNNSNTEEKAMKRNSKSNNVTSNSNSNTEEKAMKRNSKSNNVTSNSNSNNNNATNTQWAALLQNPTFSAIANMLKEKSNTNINAMIKASENKSEASEAKSQKADRTYEIPSIGADFVKSSIYARPTSETAAQYVAKAKALCSDVIDNLSSPITKEIATIADKAEKNGGDTLKSDLLQLAEKWEIPAQAMRVIMQLCAPVVGVCNAETDEIARRVYGMGRANSLMGSACNTLMYSKAVDKEKALPFKRVAHNCTTLGLDFEECGSVEECDFCDSDEDFEELVGLCDMWLAKCNSKSTPEKAAEKSTLRRATKSEAAPKSSPDSEDKSAAILAALQTLLGK